MERCVKLLESANRLRQLIDLDSSGTHVKTEITRFNDTQYEFRLRVGGRLRMYASSWMQVEAKGIAQAIDESHTMVAYDKKIVWSNVFLIYGPLFLLILTYAFSHNIASYLLLVVLVGGFNSVYEATIARDYLKALTAYINHLDLS